MTLSRYQIFLPYVLSDGKESTYNAGDPGLILGWKDPLEKRMNIHSSILTGRFLWIGEPGEFQSMGLQRVRSDRVNNTSVCFGISN